MGSWITPSLFSGINMPMPSLCGLTEVNTVCNIYLRYAVLHDINNAQVDWLVSESAAHGPKASSIAFVHIPMVEHMLAWNSGGGNGTKREDVCCQARDMGLFKALKEAGVGAVYSGHDHDNDYAAMYRGMRMAYGRSGGFGAYGRLTRGARVIRLREGEDPATSETWIAVGQDRREEQSSAEGHTLPRAQRVCCDATVMDSLIEGIGPIT